MYVLLKIVVASNRLFSAIGRRVVLKQVLGTFMILCLFVFSYSFNFPLDRKFEEEYITVQASSIDTDTYKFNRDSYLSAGTYKKLDTTGDKYKVSTYEVLPGDTVSSIAYNFNLKTSSVLGANEKGFGELIKPGEKLKIPPRDGVIYKVKKGDTFSSLEKKYDVSEKVIRRVNNKDEAYALKEGEEFLLPGVEYEVPALSRSKNVSIAGRNAYSPNAKTFSSYGGGMLNMPVQGVITQRYSSGHLAIDIANKTGTTIFAADGGTVITASTGSYNSGYGNYIIIKHNSGLTTLYGHLSKVYVTVGQQVLRGESIGALGSTGRSTGPHLHFEVRNGKYKDNPFKYL